MSMSFKYLFQQCHLFAADRVSLQLAFRIWAYASVGGALTLTGCDSMAVKAESTPSSTQIAKQWNAPMPHNGRINDLTHWWSQFDDPLLPRLIEKAQHASPTLARAISNIADARASYVASGALLMPTIDVVASTARARSEVASTIGKVSSLGLQATWELDLFGRNKAGGVAAKARLESSHAGWHDARVSVAADVAKNYVELRACEAHVEQKRFDVTSHAKTLFLTERAFEGGIQSSAAVDLARASLAQSEVILETYMSQCELLLKALVAMTSLDELTLRDELVRRTAVFPKPTEFAVDSIPAEVLKQRPDIQSAEHDIAAAYADTMRVNAQRWPQITLNGSISATRLSSSGINAKGTIWNIGPIAITFPLFDGGKQNANLHAAKVHFETAITIYASRLRAATQEVESALVMLASTARRGESAEVAKDRFERSYRAICGSYIAGSSNQFDLEDARRSLLLAQSTLIDLRRERLLAWISLYRSIGGGWTRVQQVGLAGQSTGEIEGSSAITIQTDGIDNPPNFINMR